MNTSAVVVASLLLSGSLCVAQDVSTEQSSDQSVAGAAAASRGRVQQEQNKQADIRHLLEITGAAGLATQSMDEMEKTMRPLIESSLPPGEYRAQLIDLFFEKFHSKRDPDQIIAVIVPIYDKYYSDEEIRELIKMYESPIGQKMISVLPKLAAESQLAGRTWGEQIGRQSMMEVLAEHPELKNALQNAKRTTQPQ
jgi:uncharacterized protein